MANESVYVAIAIACVVALLVLAILVIYCIKRQQDKMHERIIRERRLREEWQRRNFMRAQMVQPPSYEASRGRDQVICPVNREVPWSPPPEYKEVATPIPSLRHNQVVGIGGVPDLFNGYSQEYSEIPSVSRNVAPVYTYMPPGVSPHINNALHINNNTNNHSSSSSNTINNRNIAGSYTNLSSHRGENAIQVQVSPRSTRVLPDVVTSTTGSSSNIWANNSSQRPQQHPRSPGTSQRGNAQNNNTNNHRSNWATTNPASSDPDRSGLVQAQPTSVGSSHIISTPGRSGTGSINNDAIRNNAEGQEATQGAKNQVRSQFQDLSFI